LLSLQRMPRLGGWIMTIDEAKQWASRILNEPVGELTFADAFMTLLRTLEPLHIDVACVNYPARVAKIMIVTRRAPWSGWKLGDDPLRLPQFKLGKTEALAKMALEKHGVRGIEFVTAHGKL